MRGATPAAAALRPRTNLGAREPAFHDSRRVARPWAGGHRRRAARRARARPRGPGPRHGAAPARAWARRPHEDRKRLRRDPLGRQARADAGQPGRRPGRQPRLPELGRPHEPMARGRGGRGVAPAAARPRRPGRPSEVRLHGRAQRAGARQRARDGRPRRRGHPGQGVSASARGQHPQPRHPDRFGDRAGARRPGARGLRGCRRRPRSLPGLGDVRCDGRGDRSAAQGEREPRRKVRGARLRAGPGPRLLRRLGPQARRPPRAGRVLDPVGQGGFPGRGLGGRRSPTTRSSGTRSGAGTGRPTTPAASRAG
jgi:hypothetical protein